MFLGCHSSRSGKKTAAFPRVRHVVCRCNALVIGVTKVLNQPERQTGSLGACFAERQHGWPSVAIILTAATSSLKKNTWKVNLKWTSCIRFTEESSERIGVYPGFKSTVFTSLAQVKAFYCSSTRVYANSFWVFSKTKLGVSELKFCSLNWKHCFREGLFSQHLAIQRWALCYMNVPKPSAAFHYL